VISAGCQWLTPIILVSSGGRDQEDCVSKPTWGKSKTLSRENPSQKRPGGVAQGVDPESNPSNVKKKKKKKKPINLISQAAH
jgi:hypothetical protein